jgi:hypothetical protein
MKFGRTYNKKDNEVFVRDNEDGSIDVISNDWKEFELVQSKMFDMGFHLSEVEEWDEEEDLKIISRFSPEEQIFN